MPSIKPAFDSKSSRSKGLRLVGPRQVFSQVENRLDGWFSLVFEREERRRRVREIKFEDELKRDDRRMEKFKSFNRERERERMRIKCESKCDCNRSKLIAFYLESFNKK